MKDIEKFSNDLLSLVNPVLHANKNDQEKLVGIVYALSTMTGMTIAVSANGINTGISERVMVAEEFIHKSAVEGCKTIREAVK